MADENDTAIDLEALNIEYLSLQDRLKMADQKYVDDTAKVSRDYYERLHDLRREHIDIIDFAQQRMKEIEDIVKRAAQS